MSSTNKPKEEVNVQVVVRCRPLNSKEKHAPSCVQCVPSKREVLVAQKIVSGKELTKTFTFDSVYAPNSGQSQIFRTTVQPIIEEVLAGYNILHRDCDAKMSTNKCTIFAYGQTSSGKTYSMEGARDPKTNSIIIEKAGIIPRSINYIFNNLEENKAEYTLKVSCLELYNEELQDLLSQDSIISSGDRKSKKIRIYDDPKKGTLISGLEEVTVRQASHVMQLLDQASTKRAIAETQMNALSSRSHVITTVTIHIREIKSDGEEIIKTGKLNLVDLAGSENIGRSGAINNRAKEAGKINQSLLTLGRVITSLTEGRPHVPYRESKLTRLLQDALGGKSKTCIIATISPSSLNLEETLSTLDYAHTAKSIKNKPEINAKYSKLFLMKELSGDLENLKNELRAQREKNGVYLPLEQYENLMEESKRAKFKIDELGHDIEQLTSERDDYKEIFENEQRLHNGTQKTLQEISKKLEETTTQLENTNNELDQTLFILDATRKTEALLSSQAEEMKLQFKESIDEVVGLRNKILRHEIMEQANAETVQQFNGICSRETATIEDMLSEFSRKQSHMLQEFKEKAHVQWKSMYENVSRSILQKSKDALLCQKRHLDAISQMINTFPLGHLNQIINMEDNLKKQLKTLYDESGSDFSTSMKNLNNQLTNIDEQLQNEIFIPVNQYFIDFESKLGQFIEEQGKHLSKLDSILRENLHQRASMIAKQQQQLKELMRDQDTFRDRMKDDILHKLNELFSAQNHALKEKTSTINDTLGEQVEALSQLQHSFSAYIKEAQTNANQELTDMNSSTNLIKSKFTTQCSEAKKVVDSIQGEISTIDSLWNHTRDKTNFTIDTTSSEIVNLTNDQIMKWTLLKEDYSDKKIDCFTQLDIIQEDQESNIRKMNSDFFEGLILNNVSSLYADVNDSICSFSDVTEKKFNDLQESRKRFISEYRHQYESNGETPQKNHHSILEAFAKTDPIEDLLIKFENRERTEDGETCSSGDRTPTSNGEYNDALTSPRSDILKPRTQNVPHLQSPSNGKRNLSMRRKQPETPKSGTPRAKRRKLRDEFDLEVLPR